MVYSSAFIFIMALLMHAALATSHALPNPPHNEGDKDRFGPHGKPFPSIGNADETDTDTSPSPRSMSQHPFLDQHDHYYYSHPRDSATCDKYPRVCRASGSPGPDCCRKQCVNVMTDNFNCGECGKKCKYGEGCCGGKCVKLMYDANNCGGCKIRCKKGSFCRYGMCNYA